MSRVTDVSTAAKYSGRVLPKLGYVLWIVYGPLAESNRWLSAGLIGTVFMVAVVAAQYRQREIKFMDCTSLGYFVVETMTVLMGGTQLIAHHHLGLVWGVFAAVASLTLISGFPFTLQYTRKRVPREAWDDPGFNQMNRHMTAVWVLIFALGAVLGEIAMRHGHLVLFGMIIPSAAMAFGLVFSQLYQRRYAGRSA